MALKRRIMIFAIIAVYWRLNKVISTAENILILNIIQVEEMLLHLTRYSELTLMALHVTVSTHNGTLPDLKTIPRVLYSTDLF